MKNFGSSVFIAGFLLLNVESTFAQSDSKLEKLIAIQTALINQLRDQLVPPGTIVAFGGKRAPQGWLLCDGVVVSTSEYPKLFASIGYTFGGSGSNFGLPNLKDQFLRGASPSREVGRSEGYATATGNLTAKTKLTANLKATVTGTYQSGWPTGHYDMGTIWGLPTGNVGWGRRVLVGSGGADEGKPEYFSLTSTGEIKEGAWETTLSGSEETRPQNIAVNYIIKY